MDQAHSSAKGIAQAASDQDLMVLIVEDPETWKQIVKEHMHPKRLTFAMLLPNKKRQAIVDALDAVDSQGE